MYMAVYGSAFFGFVVILPCALIIWFCFGVANRLRYGDKFGVSAAIMILAIWVLIDFFDAIPKAFVDSKFDLTSFLGLLIFNLPIVYAIIGLVALRNFQSGKRKNPGQTGVLNSSPWEGHNKQGSHPAFVNKRSLRLYIFLALVPIPWVLFQISSFYNSSNQASSFPNDAAYQFGRQVGGLTVALLTWIPLTTYLYRRARRNALIPAIELNRKNARPPVLYLRSFADDKLKMRARPVNGRSFIESIFAISFEEVVTDHFWRYGPVVAIGKPGDKLPPLGAARDYVSNDSWKQKVEGLMQEASIIVVVIGRTGGLAWEINRVVELGFTSKLVILIPPTKIKDLTQRWNNFIQLVPHIGQLTMPQKIDLVHTRAITFPTNQTASFITSQSRDDWAYETAIDAAAGLSTRSPVGMEALVSVKA
jgi:hypothetical protein